MIDFIRGFIARKGDNFVVIDVTGIGYYLSISKMTSDEIGQSGEEATLITRLLHREDTMELFGFANEEERFLYDALNSISGIGPRMALNILSGLGAEEFVFAVENKDLKLLSTIKGLGKKTAQKLCFELDGAFDKMAFHSSKKAGGAVRDAVSALVALGYNPLDANRGVREAVSLVGEKNIDAVIRTALEIIRKQ
ncbi:Holliday junction branch migration protein RuvA [bacterium]|nr:Holliday junction branch migration protein RuvA [bacterium]